LRKIFSPAIPLGWLLGSFFCPQFSAALVPAAEPLSVAAEYYFARHDYRQAFPLWQEVLKRQPDNVTAVLRVCELQVIFEGRVACTTTLTQFLNTNAATLNAESRKLVREKISSVHSLFLTDDGQSAYYQSLNRLKKKDWAAALPFLNQAASLEKGNLRVLKDKAHCEQALGQWEPMIQTWRTAYESQPFDGEVVDGWLDSLIYSGQFDRVIEAVKRDPELPKTPRQKIAYALSLLQTGKNDEALKYFHLASDAYRPGNPPPIVWWGTARALGEKGHPPAEAQAALDKFIRAFASPPVATSTPLWDPYRLSEKLDEALKLRKGTS